MSPKKRNLLERRTSYPESMDRKMLMAAVRGDVSVMEKCLDGGAFPNAVDKAGRTAGHLAAFFGREDTLSVWLRKGGDPNIVTFDGLSAGDFAVQGKYSAFLMTWAEYADERLVLNALRPFSVMEKAVAALHLLVSEIGFSDFAASELERFFLDDRMGAIKALFRSTAFFGKSATKGIDRRRFIDAALLAASTDGARHFGRREKKMSVLETERCLDEITRYVVEELSPVARALNAVAYIFPEGAPGYAGVESVLEKFASFAGAAAVATCALDSGEVGPFDDMPVW